MTLPYKEQNEINDRYVNSIILFKKEPIYVGELGIDRVLIYTPVGARAARDMIRWTDKDLTDGPFVLGYTNDVEEVNGDGDLIKSASFVSRMPVRKWKQGLTAQNLNLPRNLAFNKALTHKGFHDMIVGDYPNVRDAWQKLGRKVQKVAFHRHFAIRINTDLDKLELGFRGHLVGSGDDIKSITLGKKFEYLREYLQSLGVKA